MQGCTIQPKDEVVVGVDPLALWIEITPHSVQMSSVLHDGWWVLSISSAETARAMLCFKIAIANVLIMKERRKGCEHVVPDILITGK